MVGNNQVRAHDLRLTDGLHGHIQGHQTASDDLRGGTGLKAAVIPGLRLGIGGEAL